MFSINYIQELVTSHAQIIYILIALGVFLEGEIVVIIAGIFAYLGSINILFVFLATFTGAVIKSVSGYYLGYFLQKKFSKNNKMLTIESKINLFFPNFLKKPFRSIFLARFLILGMHWFSLIYSGYKKIESRIFFKAESASLIVWTMFMFTLGFFFGHTALMIGKDIRNFIIIILAFFVAFLILEKILSLFVEFFGIKVYDKDNDINLQ